MALQKLNQVLGLSDPLKQYQVTFSISSLPALALAIAQQKVTGALGYLVGSGNLETVGAETMTLRAQSFSYPTAKINQSDLQILSFRRKLATTQDKSGEWKCSITETQGGGVLNTIQSWLDLIHNPLTGIRMPSTVYVSTCVVDIEGASGEVRRIYLKGFYPISYSVSEINVSSSDAVKVDVTWNYDWFTELPTGISALPVMF